MDIDPRFGLPTEADALEEIARRDQKINISTISRVYGKIVTLISGFDKSIDLKAIAKRLKEELACGGTIKQGVIELQGNHKKQAKLVLIKMGFAEESIND